MIFEIFLKVVGIFVDVIAIPVAIVANVSSHQMAMEILGWSDDVKEWLRTHRPVPLNIILTVSGFAVSGVAATIIWSAWHFSSPMYATVGDRIGFSVAGGFLYLSGLALYLLVFRGYFRKGRRGV